MNKFFFIFLFFTSSICYSQLDALEIKISINVQNKSFEDCLHEIETISGVSFSYNSDYFPVDSLIFLEAKNSSIRSIIELLLGYDVQIKSIGSNIILRKLSAKKRETNKKQKYDIKGVIYDSFTGEKLSEVTIYQVDGVRSALSKKDGSYDIKVASNKLFVELSYSRKNYFDTIISVKPSEINNITINLKPDLIKPVLTRDVIDIPKSKRRPVDSSRLVKILVPKKQKRNLYWLRFS